MLASNSIKALAVGVSALLLSGCEMFTSNTDSMDSPTEAWEQSTDLVSEYGGYEFTDENDAFGDPGMNLLALQQPVVSAADSDTVVTRHSFAVRILWGQLEGNRDIQEVTDWQGNFEVSAGRLAVLRTIAFERVTDRLLRRDNRQTVPFESKTRPHFDGLLLLIHNPDNDMNATLSMNTGPLTQSWSFEELQQADLIVKVDDLGNAVSVKGIELPEDPACLGGITRGHWLAREGERGVFRGLWLSRLGTPIGHIRGHFGVNDGGERVWFGKIIARGGRLIGLARGTYQPNDDPEVPGGTFSGHWAVRRGDRSGVIEGRYIAARRSDDGAAGFFQAHWRSNCGDEVPGDESGNDGGDGSDESGGSAG